MLHATAAQLMLIVCSHHVSASEFWPHNFLDSSNIIIIIINVVNIFIAFKMMIMIIVDVQGNIYLELSKLERERGGGRESSRKHIELIMMLVSPMSHALIPFKKQTKYDVINEKKIKICWNQLDFISANSALISRLDYLQELRWRDLSFTLRYSYLRLGKTGNKKPATSFATLLYNELNSDVAWFITHEKNLPPYRFERG